MNLKINTPNEKIVLKNLDLLLLLFSEATLPLII